MVEEGCALAFRKYSDDYIGEEHRARSAIKGIWSSRFELPEHYRLARQPSQPERRARETDQDSQWSGCVIKGNRSRRGERIYHVPGQQYYERTQPEEIFCSEADAKAAGYRRAKV